MAQETLLYGITPVMQCLLHKNRQIKRLWVNEKSSSPRVKEILQEAKKRNISIEKVDSHKLGNLVNTKLHQNVVLSCGELDTYDLDEFLEKIAEQPKKLLIALDQVEDPQNLGAILRTAAFLGASGLITLTKHSAPLTAAVSKSSAGAMEYFPIIQVGNLSECLQKLKREGFLVAGASSDNSVDYRECPLTDYMVLVMGSEGQGLRKLTQKRCDYQVHIPGNKETESLNVSAASAILIQHLVSKQ
ncbi:MAG: 23S rRNA (guanosine(2251)-2'-O)-methyltransferase RlmB [SAR324 cluster bacterium]|uniref:23S rRNA (Guanosine(2251)-2'-O)-methyltransferase RlmB n=1 Tax=SAR324 cluster bacterium TaxID=2024889 RepID=A0A2A4T7H7_9DELT|nr:MAG: 23S rRNA (guanosine(2251)-2'-O)-methyltransferase RlmB [SAR324 cluster bacterium]